MKFNIITLYISIIIWLIPPVRQFKTKYFYFFLLLGFEDVINELLKYLFSISPVRTYFFVDTFIFISLFNIKESKKKFFWISPVLLVLIIIVLTLSIKRLMIVLMVINILIFFRIALDAVLKIKELPGLSVFHIVLIFYMLTIILKFLFAMLYGRVGTEYFYLTSAFEILIGIYFIFYNINNSPILKFETPSIEK